MIFFFFPLDVHKPKRNRGNAKSACIYYLALFIRTSFLLLSVCLLWNGRLLTVFSVQVGQLCLDEFEVQL